jgi:hypothetical protein
MLLANSACAAGGVGLALASQKAQLIRLQAELDAQREARDRQADSFDAAVSRIEMVNEALVVILAIAGIAGGLLAIRWVRSLARDQVAEQIGSAIRETGEEIFEADARDLREEYEEKFAQQYKYYKRQTNK